MTQTPTDPESQALRQAASRFTRSLAAEALLGRTARVEAIVEAADAGSVFVAEAALETAWRDALDPAPHREVVWATALSGDHAVLHLRAFDDVGRLLLRQTYAAGGGCIAPA